MTKRNAFRPMSLDTLEQRLVMNGHVPSAHGPVTVGALGDSYTDEYKFYPVQNHARNWVEQLATSRKVSFGPLSNASRGEPRNQGYAQDWARADATSSGMIANQLPGLTQQVAAGKVAYASIFIGGNDFLHYLQGTVANPPTSPAVVKGQLNQIAQTVGHNIQTAVTTLLAANNQVKVVVATIPSLSTIPLAKVLASSPQGQALIAGVDQALSAINAGIRAAAGATDRVAVSDLAAQATQLGSAGASAPFDGTTITLTTASNDYHSFFLADGLHVGSVAQGVIANSFINAIDTKFGAHVSPFTQHEIVANAARIERQTHNLK